MLYTSCVRISKWMCVLSVFVCVHKRVYRPLLWHLQSCLGRDLEKRRILCCTFFFLSLSLNYLTMKFNLPLKFEQYMLQDENICQPKLATVKCYHIRSHLFFLLKHLQYNT